MKSNEPEYLQYLFLKAKEKNVPLSGTFEITGRCNFNCRMCYIHGSDNEKLKEKELSTEQWLRIADKAFEAGTLLLLITGGEPLIRNDFAQIYTYCKKLGMEISINTNASLITDETIELFKRYMPARINVTLYGACEKTYMDTTCREGYYKRVTANIEKMKSAGLPVKMNITASDYNSADIPKLYGYASENEIPVETACYLFPSARLGRDADRPDACTAAGNMLTSEKCRLSEEAFKKKAESFKDFTEKERKPYLTGEKPKCRAGTAAFWITYDGTMLPCGMMKTPSASVTENGFENAWKYINAETKKIILPPECRDCDYSEVCESCAASCYAETGSFDKVPVYLCQKSREYVRLLKEEAGK